MPNPSDQHTSTKLTPHKHTPSYPSQPKKGILPAIRLKALSVDLVRQDDKIVDKLALQDSLIGIVKLIVGTVEVCNKGAHHHSYLKSI